MMPKKEASIDAVNTPAPQTLRFLNIRGRTVAFSCFQTRMTTKQAIKTPKATDNEITLAFDHEYIEPPYWRASKRHTRAGTKNEVPKRSNCLSCARHPVSRERTRFGAWKKKIKTVVTAPKGRLI